MRTMPELTTARLRIRPFTIDDADSAFEIMSSIDWVDTDRPEAEQREAHRQQIEWLSLNHAQLASLYQPPYGDRAVVLRDSGTLVGRCGLAPYIDPLAVFPYFGRRENPKTQTEIGLFWAIGRAYQKQGFATEVAEALIAYAFTELNLHHIIATTDYDNIASQRVMEKVGMRLERNPYAEPPWLQVLGVIENR